MYLLDYTFIIILGCILSTYKKQILAVKQYARLHWQQPHYSLYLTTSLECIIFSCALFNLMLFCTVTCYTGL